MKGLIVTYLLTYGGAVVSLVNPYVGLLIYVCFAIIKPESLWFWSVPAGNYSRTIALALLTGWVVNGLGRWRFGGARAPAVMLVGFWVWGAISATQASDQTAAWETLESLAKIILPFVVGLTLIDSVPKLKALVWTIVLSQGYVALEMNQFYYAGYNRVWEEGFGGMDNNCVAIALATGVGQAFFLGLSARALWQQGLAFGSAALMAHTIMFSYSRGGMLALVLTGVLSVFLIKLRPRHWLALAVAALVGLRLAGPTVQDRFMTIFASAQERDSSAQSRLDLWSACLDAMGKRPVLGVGPHNWPAIVAEYGWPPGKEAHTLWLQIGTEVGIPGMVMLLGFYLVTMKRLWPLARQKTRAVDPWLPDAAAMVIAGLFGFMVSAQFVSLVGLEQPYYTALVGAGVLSLQSRAGGNSGRGSSERLPVARAAVLEFGYPVAQFRQR
jgi:probable O-glycosylation ligase (exosortase A-associated)